MSTHTFGPLARYYDRIYHWKPYRNEAKRVCAWLSELGVEEGARLVEAACGTGTYLALLRDQYRVAGFDVDPTMVELARAKLGNEPELWVADMCDFTLAEPADAIVCLFSSIGYVYPEARLAEAAAAFHQNLRPGGALLVEPWHTPTSCVRGFAFLQTYDGEDVKLARANVVQIEGSLSIFDMHWLVATPHGQVEHHVDRHELWLYQTDEMLRVFRAAGFDMRFEPEGLMRGRGMLLGRRAS